MLSNVIITKRKKRRRRKRVAVSLLAYIDRLSLFSLSLLCILPDDSISCALLHVSVKYNCLHCSALLLLFTFLRLLLLRRQKEKDNLAESVSAYGDAPVHHHHHQQSIISSAPAFRRTRKRKIKKKETTRPRLSLQCMFRVNDLLSAKRVTTERDVIRA